LRDFCLKSQVVNQVLDEIGISLNEGLVDVPGKKKDQQIEQAESQADKALEARLNNLNGSG